MLSFDRLTVKAAEAIQAASAESRRRGNPEVAGVHLLHALLAQEEGIVVPVLQKLGVQVPLVRQRTEEALSRYARMEGAGSDGRVSRDLNRALDVAEEEARALKDEYVSTEHLLLGLTEEKDDAGRVLRDAGATRERVREALEAVRGSHRVLDQNPEEKYQALEKYSKDLTALARRGKLDPVIGRDEEIRRVIKVLARRTKNNPVLIGEPGVGKTAIVEGLADDVLEQFKEQHQTSTPATVNDLGDEAVWFERQRMLFVREAGTALARRWQADPRSPAALPAYALAIALAGAVFGVAGNQLSRDVERAADAYALRLTDDPKGLIELQTRLAERNLGDPDPPGWAHHLLGSHPTTLERIGMAEA
ncbi:MAG: M48 family metalloprotease, partial [Gemmatimonadetes bacterium]|nr:M48 family metalloprotease [Gemmatimonadota bacterium]